MTYSPGKRQRFHKSPVGGTTADGNTRTPRRVQWNVDAQVDGREETSSQRSHHELDELGLDPSAFETLRNALERHQSEEFLESGSGLFPSVPPPAVIPLRVTTSNPAVHLNSFENAPIVSSDNPYSTSAPGTGSPSMLSSPTNDDLSLHLSSATLVTHRTHDVPGEVWIDPLEREGLPLQSPIPNVGGREDPLRRRLTWRRGSTDHHTGSREKHIERLAKHQAAGVVRTHTRRGWGWLRSPSSKKDSNSKGAREGKENQGPDKKGKATEHTHHRGLTHSHAEDGTDTNNANIHPPGRTRKGVPGNWLAAATHLPHAQTHRGRQHRPTNHRPGQSHGPKLGNGVLSALLALYDHDHDHDHDDERSVSGESTSSDVGNEDTLLPQPHRPWLPDQDDNHDHPVFKGRKGAKDKHPGKFSLSRTFKGGPASSIIGHIRHPSIPAASTTAALIAGAGTLSGAAAPQQATLAPNLERPGYNLVRYSVNEVPRVAPTTPNIIPLSPRRAYSIDSDSATTTDHPIEERGSEVESPDTPAGTIVASPTAGSDGLAFKPKESHIDPVSTLGERKRWTGRLKDLASPMHFAAGHLRALSSPHHHFVIKERGLDTPGGSGSATPKTASAGGTPTEEFCEKKGYFDPKRTEREALLVEQRDRKERERKRKKEIRRKRKKAEVYITRHVAEILQRQEFIMKLARAMMMFGGPSHRLASQIQSTGRVLDLELSCMYLPDVMLISFEDSATGTSNVKFIRQGSALDLEKLQDAHSLYWNVIHDNMSVSGASALLDVLMRKKPLYNFMQLTLIGAMCSASICSVSFSGSFIDSLASAPLGGLLVAIQLIGVRHELYANVFEITIATLLSFLSAALASTKRFCFSAVASSSVVLILPGFIVLTGSLELSSRSLVAGAVRLCFAVMYSLFLGFGLAIGAELYEKIVGQSIIGSVDYTCVDSHDPTGPWWQRTPSLWWAFLTVPMYSLFLSMRLMAPWWRKEMLLSIAIASIGWVTNHFVSTKFPNQSDISAALGAFAVGFVSNMYGRFFNGNAFVVMITGILFQVPSGLGNGGLLNFVSDQTSGSSTTYVSGFQTALQLISVAVGLTVGLGISLVVVHPVQSRRRAGGLFSL